MINIYRRLNINKTIELTKAIIKKLEIRIN